MQTYATLIEAQKLEQYGFTASDDRFMTASALEELSCQLGEVAHTKTYEGAMEALQTLINLAQEHMQYLSDDHVVVISSDRCHKDFDREVV